MVGGASRHVMLKRGHSERAATYPCPGRGASGPLLPAAIHEADAGTYERQEVRAVEATPPRLRHVEELVGHQERLRAGARPLRHALAQSDRRERRLDHV